MTETDRNLLADWAGSLLDEVLVKAAIDVHQRDDLGDELEVALTFRVSSSKNTGQVTVTSPGSRGKSINVEVPAPQRRTS